MEATSADASGVDARGSVWRRWDPHIHTPGTILSDGFGGEDVWHEYLTRIEASVPRIEALGITDYASIDRYEEVIAHKAAGRLPHVEMIFPNVELRLGIGTHKGSAVNIHLLVSPDEPDHVAETRRFLESLTFHVGAESYRCRRDELIRLGREHAEAAKRADVARDEHVALREGTNQFKVTTDVLREVFANSRWARDNILVAVAAGTNDGTSGLQDEDASLFEVRREIERLARVIFSGNPRDRVFWLGQGADSAEHLRAKRGGLKPCLHGSDAHTLPRVGAPDQDRFTWIKGDASFESLRQACIEPAERALVAPEPPTGPLPFRTITSVEVDGAPWCVTKRVELNRGLVGIVGARGSGKTALADVIAAGGHVDVDRNDRSFLHRAQDHLRGARVRLVWGDGESTTREMGEPPPGLDQPPRVRYLSQQFVEQLCSAEEGVTDELLAEIQRVIYDAHLPEDRVGTSSFDELLAVRTGRGRAARDRAEQELAQLGDRLAAEQAKIAGLPDLESRHRAADKAISDDKTARGKLIVGGGEQRSRRLQAVTAAIEDRQRRLDVCQRQKQALLNLEDAARDIRDRQLPARHAELVAAHRDAALSDEDWKAFELVFADDVHGTLAAKVAEVEATVSVLTGGPVVARGAATQAAGRDGSSVAGSDASTPYVEDDADLTTAPLAALRLETGRLQGLIGLDARRTEQLAELDRKIGQAEIALGKLVEATEDVRGAPARIAELRGQRQDAYAKVFDAITDEEEQLRRLYEPLAKILRETGGLVEKLSFSVRRVVDVDRWANYAEEELLDLRKSGDLRGRGTLSALARAELLEAWRTGDSATVASAMTAFRASHDNHLIAHAKSSRAEGEAFRAWGAEVSAWLTSTDHISVTYGIEYDGVDVAQLSPGTRGIVLLLLYLSIDQADDRPLIIDQPEENLDPKSVYTELVDRFRQTRLRRQVIIVTHNANLVVNTDADQVIVAAAGAHRRGELPEITYTSGGLENGAIRTEVCEILEGGEQAFRDRAERLRVDLER